MSVALRKCGHAFNEDVLPPHAKVAEPLEFYAAPKLDIPSRSLKDAIGKTGPGPVAARRSRSSGAEESA